MSHMMAQAALLAWPIIALGLYLSMSAARATIWTLLAGYLILPIAVGFDFPGVPSLDKSSIPSLAALVLAPLMARSGEFRWPRSMSVNLLMLLFVLVPFGTAMTNAEPITIGTVTLPGLGFREGLAQAASSAIQVVPFLLGAALLANVASHRYLLVAFFISGLFYSIPILLEIRLSPFFQQRVYGVGDVGYFLQQMRFGGFRSMVFLGHGLLVSTFIAMALIAAIGLWRMRERTFALPVALFIPYLAIVLVLNKSVGAVALVLLIAPLIVFLRPRRFVTIAFGVALVIAAYPMVRGAEILPLQGMVQTIEQISPERAQSLKTRVDNEDMLLHRAMLKPWFGWGSYGRNRVLVVTSWGATTDISVTDGTWILAVGISGWLGYIACFGLLTYPFWRAFRIRRAGLPMATVTLVAMHLLNLLDLIPNSSLRPVTWLVAGALASMTAASVRLTPLPRRVLPERNAAFPKEPAVQS